jgi:class 3 adenylate cyclase
MGLADDIKDAVADVVNADWNLRKGQVVPHTEDITLKNGAVELDAVYLYSDMADSTGLARDFDRTTAAKVIRAYLDATCRVIRSCGGQIRSFDGDRVMAIFVGGSKNSDAAKCGLQINHVVQNIVRPAVEAKLPSLKTRGYVLKHCVGVASGSALVVRGGVRDHSDLVSVGRAPNVAAKLSDIRTGYRTYITKEVFNRLNSDSKYRSDADPKVMWDGPVKVDVGGEMIEVYRSDWSWKP